jgi:arginine decarboxylase
LERFLDYVQGQFGVQTEGMVTDFLSRREGRLLLADQVDLSALVERYGAPLEIAFCPLITQQVERMRAWAEAAQNATGYQGAFLYAYATKANFAEEVVRTALQAGVHYETSAAADVLIAHMLWNQGLLKNDRYIFCNGSKEDTYIDAIVTLREAGCELVVPVLDDLDELEALLDRCRMPLNLGVRERHAAAHVNPAHPGGERFGLTAAEIAQVVRRLEGTPHRLVVYHAMVGSQLENLDAWMQRLSESATAYAQLRQQVPDLSIFNFGGGMPTSAYALDFHFDYQGFLTQLMVTMSAICVAHQVPEPALAGEFGRYTVANHSLYILEVGSVKAGQAGAHPWYLVNGSMMVTLPDALIVEDQQFMVLPLSDWEAPACEVRLAGRRTCDSDDIFPRPNQPPLVLPNTGAGTMLAIFGVGAYQQMISGRGGAHHCLSPEARRIIIEQDGDALVVREVPQQSLAAIMALLGYRSEPLTINLPVSRPAEPVRVAARNGGGRWLPKRRVALRRRSSLPPISERLAEVDA